MEISRRARPTVPRREMERWRTSTRACFVQTGPPRPRPMTTLLWLRNDLRLHDHEALSDALAGAGAGAGGRLVALYCVDPRQFGETRWGFAKAGAFRAQFLVESLADLRASMRARGGDLVVRVGAPADVIPETARTTGAGAVYVHAEPMREEADDEAAVRAALPRGVPVHVRWGHTLFHIDDLPMAVDALPRVFTEWRKQTEARSRVRPEIPAPDALPPLPDGLDPGDLPTVEALGLVPVEADPRAVMVFAGGETAALARLDAYLWTGDHLKRYKETRNGLLGADYSTKFSPYLALGCLSPRHVYWQTQRYEAERVKNDSTYWLTFELLWRDYFRFYGVRHGDRLFHLHGPKQERVDWSDDRDAFEAWAAGETGIPFVDAAMREMNRTGYLSNRMRQNVASFLTKNLSVDWRLGAAWFESLLVDYDVTSNWGNWAYNAGVGADPRDRYFNLAVQAKQYDPHGDYVRHWIPELASLPDAHIHAPEALPKAALQRYGVQLGHSYPHAIVDLDASTAALRGDSPRKAASQGRSGRRGSHRNG